MTYEIEPRLDQTTSSSAKLVKKIWSRPEVRSVPSASSQFGGGGGGDDCNFPDPSFVCPF